MRDSFVFDIEGIILDFRMYFTAFINKCLRTEYTLQDMKCYDIKKAIGITDSMYGLMLEEFYKTEYVYDLPVINKATVDILLSLREINDIVFISSFPRDLNLKVVANLWTYGIKFDRIMYTDNIHGAMYQCKAVFYISDNPSHLEDVLLSNAVGTVFALARAYNINELKKLEERYEELSIFYSVQDMLYVVRNYCRQGEKKYGRIRERGTL